MSCPYRTLIYGPISERFQLPEHRLLLLNYLTTELMSAKMCQKLNPQKQVVIEIVSVIAKISHLFCKTFVLIFLRTVFFFIQ